MKKLIIIMILIGGVFITFNQNVISWVKFNFTDKQKPYFQQRLEFFEKLSKQYYGVADFGKELDLINRSLKITELSTDRAELIIPSLEAIVRLKERQSLASIQNQTGTRIIKTVPRLSNQQSNAENVTKKIEASKSSMLFLLVGIIIISGAISLLSYLKYRRKARSQKLLKFIDDEPINTDESILLDFDLSSFEEKSQNANLKFEGIIY